MIDLFESLSTRFAPDTLPAIRPRPRSRFDGGVATGSIAEEDTFETVRARHSEPSEPHTTAQSDDRPDNQSSAVVMDRHTPDPVKHPAKRRVDLTKPESAARNSEPAPVTATDDPQTTRQRPQQIAPVDPREDETEKEGNKVPAHAERIAANTTDNPDIIREVPAAVSDDQPETDLHRIETRVVPNQPEAQAQPTSPDTSPPNTTIRIGRIEMRQPAPPSPAPAPPPPRATPSGPGSVSQGSGRGNSGSGLTDYLGWKRR